MQGMQGQNGQQGPPPIPPRERVDLIDEQKVQTAMDFLGKKAPYYMCSLIQSPIQTSI
jgi:hypothetical protein